jgi:hypothetical protein
MSDAEGMNLDEYVKETLLAIVGGVLQAQEDERCGPYVGRSPAKTDGLAITKDVHGNVVTLVAFDLATTVEAKSGKSGGIGIKVVPMLALGGEAKSETSSSAISRIAFSVSISIPVPAGQRADDKAEQERHRKAMGHVPVSGWAG